MPRRFKHRKEVSEREVVYEVRRVKVGMKIKLECGHVKEYDYYNARFLNLPRHLCGQCQLNKR